MRKLMLFIFFSFWCNGFSQEIPTPLAEGIVVTTTNERIPFKMLRKEGAEIVFNNISTGSIFRYLPNTIKKIEDFEFNILYINPEFKNEPNINEKYIPRIAKLFKPDYPEGVYLTKEDFINKAASNQQIELGNDAGPYLDEYTLACETTHFYYKDTAEKIKNVFAIFHNGYLYFQKKALLKHRSNSFKKNNPLKSYILVKNDNEINYVLDKL
jgi:hypothetical protein